MKMDVCTYNNVYNFTSVKHILPETKVKPTLSLAYITNHKEIPGSHQAVDVVCLVSVADTKQPG